MMGNCKRNPKTFQDFVASCQKNSKNNPKQQTITRPVISLSKSTVEQVIPGTNSNQFQGSTHHTHYRSNSAVVGPTENNTNINSSPNNSKSLLYEMKRAQKKGLENGNQIRTK